MKGTTLAVVSLLAGITPAAAAPVTFAGSSGSLAASVSFASSAGNLTVTLTNTSATDVLVPANVLTGVFFNVAGNPLLTKTSVLLGAGSTVVYDPDGQPAGGVVGGEWAYLSSLTNASLTGINAGISSSGLGIFGPGNRFPGANLAGPADPDGLQYGLLSAGDNPATGNGGITGTGGLAKNSVVISLGAVPVGFDPSTAISHVLFQYGTSLTEPRFGGECVGCGGNPSGDPVPEPASIMLLGAGLMGLHAARRRRNPAIGVG